MYRVIKDTDIFDYALDSVIFVDDVEDISSVVESIFCSDSTDGISKYLNMSDDDFISLDVDELQEIENIQLISRIARLDYSKLSEYQQEVLKKSGELRYYSTEVNVEELIHKLKTCSEYVFATTDHNSTTRMFIRKLKADVVSIVKNLKKSDYIESMYGTDSNIEGDRLYVFMPVVKLNDKEKKRVPIYIKIDKDLTRNGIVALVSFHKPKHFVSYRSYSN